MSNSDSQQGVCIALGLAFLILPIIAVTLRTYARFMNKSARLSNSLHSDDYLIFASLMFCESTGITMIYAAYHGHLGQRLTYSSSPMIPDQLDELIVFLKSEYILSFFAQLSILTAKLSLLALYRRIFVTRAFRTVVMIVGTIVILWHTTFIFLFLFQCLPVSAAWDLELAALPTTKCLDKLAVWESYAISDVLTDLMVLSLPVPAILSLQMSTRHKLAVSMIFLLGTIVIGTGIARTVVFFNIAKESLAQITCEYLEKLGTYQSAAVTNSAIDNSAPAMYWSFIETSLAVVGACLPTLRPLVHRGEGAGTFMSRIRGFISLSPSSRNKSDHSGAGTTPSRDGDEPLNPMKPQVYVSRSFTVESA